MSVHELENIELTNMCMIYNKKEDKVLVQIRNKGSWDGAAFPGGHVEKGEPIIPSVVREIKEETGLNISNVVSCGFKDWYNYKNNKRYFVFLFKSDTYDGELLPASNEGKNIWMDINEINAQNAADGFLDNLEVFTGKNGFSEIFYDLSPDKDEWNKRFF